MKIKPKFVYRIRDPEELRVNGNKTAKVGIMNAEGKKVTGVLFPFKYFPVMNIIMTAVIGRLNSQKRIPKEWEGKEYVSVIGLIGGKYTGFKQIKMLIEGAELWETQK